jgi:hypothetical protein
MVAKRSLGKSRRGVYLRFFQRGSHLPACLAVVWAWHSAAAPAIVMTNLPAYGSFESLRGVVLNATPAACRVAVFIYVPGYGWVTKPTCAQPLTAIQSDGSWSADITTGGSDQLATRMAALLVSGSYNQPCVNGLSFLPTNVFAQALAGAVVTRESPGARRLSFSGYEWWVKSSAGPVAPGPNYFSDSTNNIGVDAQGQLHVRITNRSNLWQCAEVATARTFGYGHYRFELSSPVDKLNVNVVLGLSTWSDDPAWTHRELDIECSRWGMVSDPNNAQFVVQPFNLPGQLVRYAVPGGLTNSTHLFAWEPARVSFQSQRGSFSPAPAPANLITNWTYTLTVPQTGDENVHINLWLYQAAPPTDKNEVEVVIKSFEFVPLGAPPPARLTIPLRLPGGLVQFLIDTQPDYRYCVQGSGNLLDWRDLATLLATNGIMVFQDNRPAAGQGQFFRAVTWP